MTRTIGTVTRATVLMLVFQTLRVMAVDAGADEAAAFLYGFAGTFQITAALPAIVVLLGLRADGERPGPASDAR